jgi:hypothetical protein
MTATGDIAALRRFAGGRTADRQRCELCGIEIGERHEHVVEPGGGGVRCACIACGGRFAGADGRILRVVTGARRVDLALDDAEWRGLGLPVAVAFFRRSASGAVSAHFPGPAGTTAAPLDAGAWTALSARHPELPAIEPEVEALLVSRLEGAAGAYLVSIDLCYRLAGILRARWRGIAGGEEAHAAIAAFFAELEDT